MTWSASAEAAPTAYTIWPATSVPTSPSNPGASVELGVRFHTSASGWVTGIRYYKSAANTGVHTGTLWSWSGAALAKVTFAGESTTGWQQATLTAPVKLAVNTDYVASYRAPQGGYAADTGTLSPSRPAAAYALTATQGTYSYGSTVPKRTWRGANYFVDVAFTTTAPAPAPSATPTGPASPAPPEPTSTECPPTTTPTAPPAGPPSGPGITPYASLANQGTLAGTVNAMSPAGQVSFMPGSYDFGDFAGGAQQYGLLLWHTASQGPSGILGTGKTATVFQMRPNSSGQGGQVPPQSSFPYGTNPLYLMRADGPSVLSGFTLAGSPQGHLYNGLILYYGTDARVSDVLVKGIPGDNSANPGETFSINLYKASNAQLNRVEIDGRNTAGAKAAASGLGINFGSGTVVTDLYVHDLAYGHGVAAYTTQDVTLIRPRVEGSVRGLNFERVAGSVQITQPYFRGQVENGQAGPHIAIASDTGSASYTITDPNFDGPKLRVRVTGYMGNPRTQDATQVHLLIGGVQRPDLLDLRVQN